MLEAKSLRHIVRSGGPMQVYTFTFMCIQIFERWYFNRNMEQNVKEGFILGLMHS